MKILAHRGFWNLESEKNSEIAFKRAFEKGFGIETDIRDYKGQLVISHNIATESCILFEDVLKLRESVNPNLTIAINIKADGLQDELLRYKDMLHDTFVFDMSIPEQVVYDKMNISFYTRRSEIETIPVMYDKATGIWMDEWESSWINNDIISTYLDAGKTVSIISPEIHKRDNSNMWRNLYKIRDQNFYLCTDLPKKAMEFFYGKN